MTPAAALRRIFTRRDMARIACGLCRGSGKLWGRDHRVFDCPECHGSGQFLVMRQRLRFVAEAAGFGWLLLLLGLALAVAP